MVAFTRWVALLAIVTLSSAQSLSTLPDGYPTDIPSLPASPSSNELPTPSYRGVVPDVPSGVARPTGKCPLNETPYSCAVVYTEVSPAPDTLASKIPYGSTPGIEKRQVKKIRGARLRYRKHKQPSSKFTTSSIHTNSAKRTGTDSPSGSPAPEETARIPAADRRHDIAHGNEPDIPPGYGPLVGATTTIAPSSSSSSSPAYSGFTAIARPRNPPLAIAIL